MKIPTASSATSSQRGQTSLRSLMPRLPRSNVYSMRDPENPSASVHRKRFLTPSLALKFLCTGELNPRIEERQIIQLRTTFLQGNPYADQMDPGSSLYDLAAIVFPGKAIMLREHFRCVEPIIRFSSQFYPQPLVPLRLPTAAERIDPPLVDIFVTDGKRDARGINDAEAQIIIHEIK